MRRSFKSIYDRRAEPLTGNSFRNDQIEIECIELAQITKPFEFIRSRYFMLNS